MEQWKWLLYGKSMPKLLVGQGLPNAQCKGAPFRAPSAPVLMHQKSYRYTDATAAMHGEAGHMCHVPGLNDLPLRSMEALQCLFYSITGPTGCAHNLSS